MKSFGKYVIVTGSDHQEVQEKVNSHLENGAMLVGGLATSALVYTSTSHIVYSQALVYPV